MYRLTPVLEVLIGVIAGAYRSKRSVGAPRIQVGVEVEVEKVEVFGGSVVREGIERISRWLSEGQAQGRA